MNILSHVWKTLYHNMILYYQKVIILTTEKCVCDNSFQGIIVQDSPKETGFSKKQSREDKKYVSREKNRIPRVPRHHKWISGRSAVSLHR